jgi:hypothetical protein
MIVRALPKDAMACSMSWTWWNTPWSGMRSLALTHAALILCLIARFRPMATPPAVIALSTHQKQPPAKIKTLQRL